MAIAIPLLMTATTAGAAVAGAIGGALGISATAAAIGTSLVLGATGVNAKIDKAASKVFGKDLVTLANVAGAFYMATDGFNGWGGEGAGSATDLSLTGGQAVKLGDAGGALSTEASKYGLSGGLQAPSGAGLSTLPAGVSNLPADILNPAGVKLGALKSAGTIGNVTNRPIDRALDAWKGADATTKSALIQAGGQVLSGYSQGKMAEEQARMQEERDRRYRSGSGLTRW